MLAFGVSMLCASWHPWPCQCALLVAPWRAKVWGDGGSSAQLEKPTELPLWRLVFVFKVPGSTLGGGNLKLISLGGGGGWTLLPCFSWSSLVRSSWSASWLIFLQAKWRSSLVFQRVPRFES
ncbi:uncharacterized protein DS421_19g651210 [Arachis hypogaea]|uniref:Secreted protein n=1 Tax=Arachis hypogaea TaxID=3818 RepID=A0A6B9V6F9_ARAHY|nr:uncharacterized protein DS421_19g651210 [Arachis hypogaea]